MPGLVALVSRRGETHVEAIGRQSFEAEAPMRRDTIFRIASMTKPITAAATLILVEECKLRLDDPVDEFLPELANRRVLKSLEGPVDDTVPARRADHRARSPDLHLRPGRGDGVAGQVSDPEGDGRARPRARPVPARHVGRRVHEAPGQPAADLSAGRALALPYRFGRAGRADRARFRPVASRRSCTSDLFEPLGMRDTGFSVPADKLDRLASAYMDRSAEEASSPSSTMRANSRWSKPRAVRRPAARAWSRPSTTISLSAA